MTYLKSMSRKIEAKDEKRFYPWFNLHQQKYVIVVSEAQQLSTKISHLY